MRIFALLALIASFNAIAAPATMFGRPFPFVPGGQDNPVNVNSSGQVAIQLLTGEDQANNVLRVEGQFLYKPIPHADTQVKAAAGFIHTVTCSSDAAATAGTIDIRDGTAAGGGTLIQTLTYTTNNYPPVTLTLDVATTTGIYMDYTTTNDVDCVVSYR